MTDTMLFGVLKMPFEMAMSDEISRLQYYARVQELVGRFEAQQQSEPDRRPLQAEGKHPAPCARHCEAKAFEIEIRSLKSALKHWYSMSKQQAEPVAWMHEGTLGRYFNENRNDVHSIPLYCASMTHDSDFIQIPVAYQYAYPDGVWRCSYGDEINGSRPISSRALYARKDGK